MVRSRTLNMKRFRLQNPHRLSQKEQARRYRRIHRMMWTRIRKVLDREEDQTWLVRQLATDMVDEVLDPVIKEILDPELAWVAEIKRKGYTITIKPNEGRTAPILED